MDKFVVQGGKPLHGDVRISGAKNAALPVLASALLAPGTSTFHNIPDLVDIKTIKKLLINLGLEIEGNETVRLVLSGVQNAVFEGNAAALGLNRLSAFGHALEDALDAVRKRRLEVSPDLVSVLHKERMLEDLVARVREIVQGH